jgi:NAD(P)-dependent dehydrogenase (short-subunit alcohol dehydrogenase family)
LYYAAGANFIVSPSFKAEIARLCTRRKILYMLGCATETEISTAEEYGAGKIISIASLLSFQGGTNVNAIAPGYMATDNTTVLRSDPNRAPAIFERITAGRWGAPDGIKGAAAFLASSVSDYLHGGIIPLDGGWLAR